MEYVIRHPTIVLLFFTIPLFSWVLYNSFPHKVIRNSLLICVALLLPCLTGYYYVIGFLAPLLLYIALSCVFYYFIKKQNKPLVATIIPTIVLFLILGVISFYAGFIGNITVNKVWEVKGYKIEYLKDQGFSGGALMEYELYEYATIPIFIKHVDSKADLDTTNNCIVKFEYKNFKFDKCSLENQGF